MKKKADVHVFTGDGPDWHNNALLMHTLASQGFGNRWWLYGAGYKEAADRLVSGIDDGQGRQDFLVYPILYLYRHYFEVMIKGQIREAQKLLEIAAPRKPKNKSERIIAGQGHNIAELWDYLLTLVYRLHPEQDPDLLANGTRVITAFTNLDGVGDAFRYPESLEGRPTLTSIDEINLRVLRDDIEQASGALYQIEGVLDYELELAQQDYEYLGQID